MCGIFGIWGNARDIGVDAPACLRHRGPDDEGTVRLPGDRGMLAHARLAIQDPSERGRQPMLDPSTDNVVVFNGEIYNHRELRSELGPPPGGWRSETDTETLLRAYAVWGLDALPRLRGMFALLIYDASRDALVAARDRLGIKPLYHREKAGSVRFCSEARFLLDAGRGETLLRRSVGGFLQRGAFPESDLPVAGLHAIPPGECRVFHAAGKSERHVFWRPDFRARPCDREDAVERVRAAVQTAVQSHLLSDVPVAVFLSGGLDSSIVASVASKHIPKLDTISVAFDEREFDESAVAARVAERCGSRHHVVRLNETEAQEAVREGVERMDLPSVDALNTYIVARTAARRGIKVALSGLGGDELFGGYPAFRELPWLRAAGRLPAWLRRPFVLAGPRGRAVAGLPRSADPQELAYARRDFWSAAELGRAGMPPPSFRADPDVREAEAFSQVSWAELSGYTRNMLLRDADQMSMAVSLEVRVPLLDHELVETAARIPERWKVRERGSPAKPLLLEAFRDELPPEVYNRPRQGFVLPMDRWMRGPLNDMVEQGLREFEERAGSLSRWARSVERGFQRGRLHWTRLWTLVVLGHWMARLGVIWPERDADS